MIGATVRHRSTGSHSSEAFGALYCQISDLGSDSDNQQQQRIVGRFTTFLFLHHFRKNLGIYVGLWQEERRCDFHSEHKRRRHGPRDMLHRNRYMGSCSLIIG